MMSHDHLSIDRHSLTWTTLLGRWVEFAQASLAIPEDENGERWRRSVPAVINLQAVTFALGELAELPPADRPLARDKAELLIAEAARTLRNTWFGEPMPDAMLELLDDARAAMRASVNVGTVEFRWTGQEPRIMPDSAAAIERAIDACDQIDECSLCVMQPGTIVMPGEPVAWTSGPIRFELDGFDRTEVDEPRQVYRQTDEAGRINGDLIAPLATELPPGMPLLVPILAEGQRLGSFTIDADRWLEQQRRAMDGPTIPVREHEPRHP